MLLDVISNNIFFNKCSIEKVFFSLFLFLDLCNLISSSKYNNLNKYYDILIKE